MDKFYLEYLLERTKKAIAESDCLAMGWYMTYAATLYRDNDPNFISRPLIYHCMTEAEKAEYLRLNKLLSVRRMNDIEPICKLCLAVYKRELPKITAELQQIKKHEITIKYE